MRMKKNLYRMVDLNVEGLKIQKINEEENTVYRKWNNGLEEWYEFYDGTEYIVPEGSSYFDILPLIKSYRNSKGYEYHVTAISENGIMYTDNLGNGYMQYESMYCGEMSESRNGLRYRFDDNNNLIYYMAPDGTEHRYSYNEENLITEYRCISGKDTKIMEWLYDYENRITYERESLLDNDSVISYCERAYDDQKRQIKYRDFIGNEINISAYTEYDDENKCSETRVFRGTQLIDHYITKSTDASYGLGYKK